MAETTGTWFSETAATLGDRIAGAREAAGMTPADMARRLGVRLRTVQAWEDDQLDPRANRLQMLAGMLNVSLRWLLTGEGDGLDAPVSRPDALPAAAPLLAELARMRAQTLVLAKDMGHLEKRLRTLLRETTE